MAKPGARERIALVCEECKQRNYNTKKNKMNTTEKIQLLQKLLERRYPADIYDVSAKNSIFR